MSDPRTILERLQAKVAASQERTIRLSPPDDPQTVLVCRVPTDGQVLERLQKGARPKRADATTPAQPVPLARSVLVEFTERIECEGVLLADDEGVPLRPRDQQLRELLDVPDGRSVVGKLISSDGYIIAMAAELLAEGGFTDLLGDEVRAPDPT